MSDRIVVLRLTEGRAVDLLAGPGAAHVVVGPHMGAQHRTMCRREGEQTNHFPSRSPSGNRDPHFAPPRGGRLVRRQRRGGGAP